MRTFVEDREGSECVVPHSATQLLVHARKAIHWYFIRSLPLLWGGSTCEYWSYDLLVGQVRTLPGCPVLGWKLTWHVNMHTYYTQDCTLIPIFKVTFRTFCLLHYDLLSSLMCFSWNFFFMRRGVNCSLREQFSGNNCQNAFHIFTLIH